MNNNVKKDTSDIIAKKSFLKRYRKHKLLIARLKRKLESYEDRLIALNSPNLSGMPKGGLPVSKDDILSSKIETEKRIESLKKRGARIRAEIIEKIDALEDVKQAELLEAYCIDCKSFDDIANEMCYSTRRLYSIYSEAINNIEL